MTKEMRSGEKDYANDASLINKKEEEHLIEDESSLENIEEEHKNKKKSHTMLSSMNTSNNKL